MADPRAPILIIDDCDEDFEILRWALRKAGVDHPLIRFAKGSEVMDYLGARGAYAGGIAYPLLILLDLNIPAPNGQFLLRTLRSHVRFKTVPVVVISSSTNPRDVRACYESGAHGYMVKPVDLERFERMIEQFARYWLEAVVLPSPGITALSHDPGV